MDAPIVEVRDVIKDFGMADTTVRALDRVDLAIHAGELALIEGPSGSGKTTLLSILGLLMRPSTGRVFVRGEDVTDLPERELPRLRASTVGFVFQGFNLFKALTAVENVAIAIRMKAPKTRRPTDEAVRLLTLVGLEKRLDHRPDELSGGQRQRVAIARALGGSPALVLGDEPTAALDTKTGLSVMELLADLAKSEGRAVVVVTHDHRLRRFATRIVTVEDGKVEAVPGAPPT